MTECEFYYLAGIIDGEGCVTVNFNRKRNTYSLRFTVSSTDKILVEWLKEKIGGNYYLRKKQEQWHREKYEWVIHAYKPQELLVVSLANKVIIKKRQLELAKKFLKLSGIRGVTSKRAKIREQIMIANARGRETERQAPFIRMKLQSVLNRNIKRLAEMSSPAEAVTKR